MIIICSSFLFTGNTGWDEDNETDEKIGRMYSGGTRGGGARRQGECIQGELEYV